MSELQTAYDFIKGKVSGGFQPKLGLILGSGLSALADQMTEQTVIPFQDVPGLPKSSVEGHKGAFILGNLNGVPVVCLGGRLHVYEGAKYSEIALLVRIIRKFGCEKLLITNASGSLREEVKPGRLGLITDHINFQSSNPLVGYNDDIVGPRFFGMEDAYHLGMRETLLKHAKDLELELAEGVYISVLGPNFETPAEIRAFRMWGADFIGMSTVPEVLAARHCGLQVAVIATVTNLAAGMVEGEVLSHEHTLHHAKKAANDLIRLVNASVSDLADEG